MSFGRPETYHWQRNHEARTAQGVRAVSTARIEPKTVVCTPGRNRRNPISSDGPSDDYKKIELGVSASEKQSQDKILRDCAN